MRQMPELYEVEPLPAAGCLSMFSVFQPARESSTAMDAPMTPEPMITASAVAALLPVEKQRDVRTSVRDASIRSFM